MGDSTFGPVRESFRALAVTIVPEARDLDAAAWDDLERIVEQGLASRPAVIRRQLRLLVRALDLLPVLRFGKTFRALDPVCRTAFLMGVQDAPFLLLRRGFWGLRTLVFMGYYSRQAARDVIGYRANAGGWGARGREAMR
jgi:hypothetical protein